MHLIYLFYIRYNVLLYKLNYPNGSEKMTTRPPALDNNYFGSAAHLAATEATTRNMVHARNALDVGPGSMIGAIAKSFNLYRLQKGKAQQARQPQPQQTYLTTEMALEFADSGFTERDQIIEEQDAIIAERDAEIARLKEQLDKTQKKVDSLRANNNQLWMSDAAHGLIARVFAATLCQVIEDQSEIATYVAWTFKNTLNYHNANSKVYSNHSLEDFMALGNVSFNHQVAIKDLFDEVNKIYKCLELRLQHYKIAEEIKKGNGSFPFKPVSSYDHYLNKAMQRKDLEK